MRLYRKFFYHLYRRINIYQVVIGNFFAVQLGEYGAEVAVVSSLLMRVFAIAQGLAQFTGQSPVARRGLRGPRSCDVPGVGYRAVVLGVVAGQRGQEFRVGVDLGGVLPGDEQLGDGGAVADRVGGPHGVDQVAQQLAEALRVAPSRIALRSGPRSREKVFAVAGVTSREAERRLTGRGSRSCRSAT